MALAPGHRVDRYEILAPLGSGGMGEVYRAFDAKLAREVALKIVRADVAGAVGRERLLREARAVAALSHPNVVALFDVGEIIEPADLAGTPYLAMELVVGQSLRALVGNVAIPVLTRLTWLTDIGRALAAAHDAEIVHRDVKPENVIVRTDGVVKVLDFGIARRLFDVGAATAELDSNPFSTTGRIPSDADIASAPTEEGPSPLHLTAPGTVVGTPAYMAPEQLRGEEIDAGADQFAWAVLAYELLSGALPWRTKGGLTGIIADILEHQPRRLADTNPVLPAAVSRLVERAMAKRTGDRWPSMHAVVASLERERGLMSRENVSPVPTLQAVLTRTSPVGSSARPRRLVVGATALAAGIAFAAFAATLIVRARGKSNQLSTEPVTSPSPTSSNAGEACTTDSSCVRRHAGAPFRCHRVRHECVAIASEDCTPLYEPQDLDRDDTIWFGAMYPSSGKYAASFEPERLATDLARKDFSGVLGTSGKRADALRARSVALVMCDEATDPLRATRHLVEHVETPAVLGFQSPEAALRAIPNLLLPASVATFITMSQAPSLTRIPEPQSPRLVWRSTLNAEDSAEPISAVVSDYLEPLIRRTAAGKAPLRVAILRSTGAINDQSDAIFRALRFNEKSALENRENLRQYVISSAENAGSESVVKEIVLFKPHVLISGTRLGITKVLEPLSKQVSNDAELPYVIYRSYFDSTIENFIGRNPVRRHKIIGMTNETTTMTNAQLVLHYNVAHPENPVIRTEAPQPSYDAFYLLAYAAYSLGDAPIDGPSLSRAIDRLLPPGKPIDVGPRSIFEAFQILRSGGSIDLNGAIGPLDFDRTTGEASINYSILCVDVDSTGMAHGSIDSGMVYDSKAKKLVGTMKCP